MAGSTTCGYEMFGKCFTYCTRCGTSHYTASTGSTSASQCLECGAGNTLVQTNSRKRFNQYSGVTQVPVDCWNDFSSYSFYSYNWWSEVCFLAEFLSCVPCSAGSYRATPPVIHQEGNRAVCSVPQGYVGASYTQPYQYLFNQGDCGCSQCPDGTFNTGTGSSNGAACIACDVGSCGAGNYIVSECSSSSDRQCAVCVPNFYCSDGLGKRPCPASHPYSSAGSTSLSHCYDASNAFAVTISVSESALAGATVVCACPAGQFVATACDTSFNPGYDAVCQTCPAGYSWDGSAVKTPCPGGYYSLAGSTTCGYEFPSSRSPTRTTMCAFDRTRTSTAPPRVRAECARTRSEPTSASCTHVARSHVSSSTPWFTTSEDAERVSARC